MLLDGADPEALARAARHLAAGELVAFATETVYGLGARADDDHAVAKIYAAKGRPAAHPLIVHVLDAEQARRFADPMPPLAERLIAAHWPGPLTVIVPRKAECAAAAAGHQATIGLRSPSHPIARALLARALAEGVAGVAAPSANRFGRLSPTTALHVVEEFGSELMVLDGGATQLGIESSIVDCSRAEPVLLRPGQLARERIEDAAGARLSDPDANAPRAPGTLAAHYAPRARLRLMSTKMLRTALDVLGQTPLASRRASTLKLAVYSRSVVPPAHLLHRPMPADVGAAAHELYATLRELDAAGVDLIWVEEPPADSQWDGVRDRLLRAAAA